VQVPRHTGLVLAVLLALCLCGLAIQSAAQLRSAADRILMVTDLLPQRRLSMYAQIVFHSGESTTTYTVVTSYTEHESYVSFHGKAEGSDEIKHYEVNRTSFDWVEKTPQ